MANGGLIDDYLVKGAGAPSAFAFPGGSTGVPSLGSNATELGLYLNTTNDHLYAWDGSAWHDVTAGGGGGAMVQLYDSTLAGSAGSFNPTGLPTTYTSLLVHFTLRCDQASGQVIRWQFHGDTGAHYDWDIMYGGAGGDAGAGSTADTSARFGEVEGTGAAANKFTIGQLWLPNYANIATDKGWQGMCHNTVLLNEIGMGVWTQTNAIDSIKVFPAAGSFVAGSRLTVWGIL